MAGIHDSIEYEHTVALLGSGELEPEDQTMLRVLLQGKTITKDRASHAIIKEAAARGDHSQQAKSGSAGSEMHA